MDRYFCFYISSLMLIQISYSHIYDGTILTPYIRNGSCSIARTLSRVDPKNFQGVKSYSGFITVKDEYDSNIFFWYFPHEKAAEKPWLIWLQGGPGFTSMLGLFNGVGPLKIEDGDGNYVAFFLWTTGEKYSVSQVGIEPTHLSHFGRLRRKMLQEETLANDYSLLFVDNPVGAGFSYTREDEGYTTGQDEVGEQLLEFVLQFLQLFPELQEAPLFIAGESYAGKYVPTLGVYIHRHKSKGGCINLKGISIGNGLIDPRNQLGHSELCSVLGILGEKEVRKLKKIEREGIMFIDEGRMIDAANKFNESIEFIKAKSGVNIYNLLKDPSSSAPKLEEFVTRSDVREWIHAGHTPFNFNNQYVYNKMLPDMMNTTRPFVEELLEHYGVLLYSGQLDIILPYALSKRVYAQLQWSQRAQYENAPRMRTRISANGTVIAYRQSGGNLVVEVIRRAGHMVPTDQPEVFRFTLNTFTDEFA